MRMLVESFRRLLEAERITENQVRERVVTKKITEDEYEYITGKRYKGATDDVK